MRKHLKNWRNRTKDYQRLGEKGKVISLTKIYNPPAGFGELPYYVGMIEFENGERKPGQLIVNGIKPKIGDQVVGKLRRIGKPDKKEVIQYGVKFKLI